MTNINFEPLPDDRRGANKRRHTETAAQLRERPGEWAHIFSMGSVTSATSRAYDIQNGRIAAYRPPGAFEARSRTADGTYRVYARYIGDNHTD
ncbi:hypothetical protein L1085_016175 [Streptomyces sp. MSC1_001]|jgi:hypothetical protein|uniref:hypothetical protein n=1 Tax=Streptomyces sp. MSC1_001 TaxID=2909263 RepID=UPI00202FA364|nr:hypothetical protein [Streptomyces sp. MSC1_001]